MFQLVVSCPVGPVSKAAEHGKASGIVNSSARLALHKRPRNRVHLMEAGISQAFLGGKSIACDCNGCGAECECILNVEKLMFLWRKLWRDQHGRRNSERIRKRRRCSWYAGQHDRRRR